MNLQADGLTEADLILIAQSLAPAAPPPDVQARVLARIHSRIAGPAASSALQEVHSSVRTLRRGDGDWLPMAPDVDFKLLHDDGAFASMLVRLQPGARLPAHGHPGNEECYVVHGDVWLSGVHLQAGDFQFVGIDVIHENIHSEGGCLLHIRASSGAVMAAPE